MLYLNQTVSLCLSTEPDPSCTAEAGTMLSPAALKIRSAAIVALDAFHHGDSEVSIRFLTAVNDEQARDDQRNVEIEASGVMIIGTPGAFLPSALRETARSASLHQAQARASERRIMKM